MISITAPTPSCSDNDGGNFSSHAQGFASSSLANSLETLLDSGIFPAAPFPGQVLGGGIPPASPARLSGMPCPEQGLPCDPPANANLKVAAKKGDQTLSRKPTCWDASGEKPWTLLPDPVRHWGRWEPSFGSLNPQQEVEEHPRRWARARPRDQAARRVTASPGAGRAGTAGREPGEKKTSGSN